MSSNVHIGIDSTIFQAIQGIFSKIRMSVPCDAKTCFCNFKNALPLFTWLYFLKKIRYTVFQIMTVNEKEWRTVLCSESGEKYGKIII